jgi:hypothetical protein
MQAKVWFLYVEHLPPNTNPPPQKKKKKKTLVAQGVTIFDTIIQHKISELTGGLITLVGLGLSYIVLSNTTEIF